MGRKLYVHRCSGGDSKRSVGGTGEAWLEGELGAAEEGLKSNCTCNQDRILCSSLLTLLVQWRRSID